MDRGRIERFEFSDQGTFGRFSIPGFACFTGELPWRDNAPGKSCIPIGIYRVVWAWSPRLRGFTFRILQVPGRAGVLFHSANLMGDADAGYVAQLEGCIALGERLGRIDAQRALLISRPAVRRFEALMAGNPFDLEIVNA